MNGVIKVYLSELRGGNMTDALTVLPMTTLLLNAADRHLRITGIVVAIETEELPPRPEKP